MCSEYEYFQQMRKVDESIGFTVHDPALILPDAEFHVRIYGQAPIVVLTDGKPQIQIAQFSLRPPGTPYSTFNARLADWDEHRDQLTPIYAKATWKKPFTARRCLVPMTAFYEPIYLGEHEGKVMSFTSTQTPVLLAAGVYDECPHPKKPGEIYVGFAVIVHTALPYVLETGHHRSPVFLAPSQALEYLSREMKPEERYEFLLDERFAPDLRASEKRALAKGWEKRVASNIEAHNEELTFVKKFSRTRGSLR